MTMTDDDIEIERQHDLEVEALDEKLLAIRSVFENKMSDAWQKYDSSEYENDLEDYGEDYEKAYDYLFEEITKLFIAAAKQRLGGAE